MLRRSASWASSRSRARVIRESARCCMVPTEVIVEAGRRSRGTCSTAGGRRPSRFRRWRGPLRAGAARLAARRPRRGGIAAGQPARRPRTRAASSNRSRTVCSARLGKRHLAAAAWHLVDRVVDAGQQGRLAALAARPGQGQYSRRSGTRRRATRHCQAQDSAASQACSEPAGRAGRDRLLARGPRSDGGCDRPGPGGAAPARGDHRRDTSTARRGRRTTACTASSDSPREPDRPQG